MSSYIFSQIRKSDAKVQKKLHTLLANAGISMEQEADFTLGVFDEDYNLIATGSASGNHLHSLAVANAHRGKGLLSQVLTYLYDLEFSLGNMELYLKAKEELVPIFNSMGFFAIAPLGEEIYMGNLKALNSSEAELSA